MNIHPTAIIEDGAEVHPTAKIGPYSIIESGAVIGADCVIESNVRIYGATHMGVGNHVCHGATIGAEPQDLTYTPERSKPLVIGDHNQFKHCVNISRGVKSEQGTIIGSHNFLMAFVHIGHDCIVGDHNIFANTATLGGHVVIAHHSLISAHVAVHQFCRIGAYVIVGGVSAVTQDLPPYVMANGQRVEIVGLNLVGLKRNNFDQATRSAIKRAYKVLYKSGLSRADALAELKKMDGDEIAEIVRFVEASERGLAAHA
jgi:UDP-N-acetylglucosamine acyltransferase